MFAKQLMIHVFFIVKMHCPRSYFDALLMIFNDSEAEGDLYHCHCSMLGACCELAWLGALVYQHSLG